MRIIRYIYICNMFIKYAYVLLINLGIIIYFILGFEKLFYELFKRYLFFKILIVYIILGVKIFFLFFLVGFIVDFS